MYGENILSNTLENTPKKNKISPQEHGTEVTLDPEFLLKHALYMPDGETFATPGLSKDVFEQASKSLA